MLYVLLAVAVFGLITSSVFTGMVLAAVPRYLRERRAAESELKQRPGFTPPLTLLKPLAGAEPDLEAHLASFFEQDYPEFEILLLRTRGERCRPRDCACRGSPLSAGSGEIHVDGRASLHQCKSRLNGGDGEIRDARHLSSSATATCACRRIICAP